MSSQHVIIKISNIPDVAYFEERLKLSEEFKGRVTVLKVEADGNQAIMQAYGIDEIPSFIVFSKGELITKTSGFREEAQLKELFDQAIGTIR